MYESIIEKIYGIVQNPVLWIVVLYFILFAILTLCKFWDGLFEDGVSYIKNIIYFIYLPILLAGCIMGSFCSTVINMVKGHVPETVRGLLKIIFYPLLLLEVTGQKISRKSLPGRYIDVENSNIRNKLKIYQQCTKNLINIDASFLVSRK